MRDDPKPKSEPRRLIILISKLLDGYTSDMLGEDSYKATITVAEIKKM